MKLATPTIKELAELVKMVKEDISDEYRADPDDTIPGIQLTVGIGESDWSFQTGDNSFMGSAYHYPYWGVVSVYRRSNSRELAKDIVKQVEELAAQDGVE